MIHSDAPDAPNSSHLPRYPDYLQTPDTQHRVIRSPDPAVTDTFSKKVSLLTSHVSCKRKGEKVVAKINITMNEKGKSWVLAGGAVLALAGLWLYYDSQREDEAYLDGNTLALPVVELKSFFEKEKKPEEYEEECKKVAFAFHNYGLCIVRDPRVNEKDNSVFIDMMERYFEGSDGVRDARPEVGFQVGVTPEYTEKPLEKCKQIGAFGPDDKPLTVCPPELDPKWRFFWRIGPLA